MDLKTEIVAMGLGSWADWFAGTMSFAAVVVALLGYKLADWQRKKDQLEAEKAAARQIALKLLEVTNGILVIKKHFDEPYAGPPLEGVAATQRWRRTHPLVGLEADPDVRLNAPEQALLMKAGAHAFLMDQKLAVSRYEASISSMKDYATRYQALFDLHPPPVEFDGKRVVHAVTKDELLKLSVYANSLEYLLLAVIAQVDENAETLKRLCREYTPLMQKHFGKGNFEKLALTNDNDDEQKDKVEKTRMWKLGRKIRDTLNFKLRK